MTNQARMDRLRRLEQRRAELRARLPRHSPPTAMLVEMDEIEDEWARLSEEQGRSNEAGKTAA